MQQVPASTLRTARLLLTPLRVPDADAMVPVLANGDLYRFTGGAPPSLEELEDRYRAQVVGPQAANQAWYNWLLRSSEEEAPIGFVQASVEGQTADLAWVVGTDWQGRGFATEAARAMLTWLSDNGVDSFTAHIHPDHTASERVAFAIGLRATKATDDDGEVIWARSHL